MVLLLGRFKRSGHLRGQRSLVKELRKITDKQRAFLQLFKILVGEMSFVQWNFHVT